MDTTPPTTPLTSRGSKGIIEGPNPSGTSLAGRHRFLQYRPGLDGLRAICVLAVVAYHFSPETWTGGLLGVSVFFTLSGYLITTLLLLESERTGTADLGAFWARRIRRLAPAAIVTTLVVLLLASWEPWGWSNALRASDPVAAVWSYMNWHQVSIAPTAGLRIVHPLSPYWSLAVEEQFYAIIGVIYLGVRHLRRPAYAMLGITAVAWIGGAATARFGDLSPTMAEWGTHVRAPEIAAGAILACVLFLMKRQPKGRVAEILGWAAFATLLALFLFTAKTQWWLFHGGFALVSVVSVGVLIGLLADGPLSRVLGWRPLALLGTMSYAIYLVHWPVRVAIVPENVGGLDGASLAALRLVVALVLAALLHFGVERPFMKRFPASPRRVFLIWIGVSLVVTGLAYGLLT